MERESLPKRSAAILVLLLFWILLALGGGPLTASNSLPASIPTAIVPDAALTENESFHWPVSDIEAARQFGSIIMAQHEYMLAVSRKLAARWENISLHRKLIAYFKRAFPLVSWTNLCGAAQLKLSIFLMANCLHEQRTLLLDLPFQKFMASYSSALLRVGSFNALDGIAFSRAMLGLSSGDYLLLNIFSVLQFALLGLVIIDFPIRFGIKWAFFTSITCTFLIAIALEYAVLQEGGAILRGDSSGDLYVLENLRTVFALGLNILNIVFGSALVVAWFRSHKANWALAWVRSGLSMRQKLRARYYDQRKWSALIKYDDEIARAVTQIKPFGDAWIDELAIAYFSLHEDKRCLPSIVSKIIKEAQTSGLRSSD